MRLPSRALVTAPLPLLTLVAFLAAALVVLSSPPAEAHARMTSSDPRDGAQLPTSPEKITLNFNEEIGKQFLTVDVRDDKGGKAVDGEPQASGQSVTLAVAEPLANGKYAVTYKVVSADGHSIAGSLSFSVQGAQSAGSPSATGSTAATSGSSGATNSPAANSGTPQSGQSATASPTPTSTVAGAQAESDDGEGGGIPPFVWMILVFGGISTFIITRRYRRDRGEREDRDGRVEDEPETPGEQG